MLESINSLLTGYELAGIHEEWKGGEGTKERKNLENGVVASTFYGPSAVFPFEWGN